MPTELSQCITSEQWDRAAGICQSQPQQARHWSTRVGFFEGVKNSEVLPLHEICANERAPVELVSSIIDANPEAVGSKETAYQRLPIHIACRRTHDVRVVQMLLDRFANGSLAPDTLGRLPVHYALSNGAKDNVIELLLQRRPACARGMDKRGWLPLHVACSVGASAFVIQRLIEAYPEGTVIKTNKGTSVERCMDSHTATNKREVYALLQKHKQPVEEMLAKQAPIVKSSPLDEPHYIV